MPADLPTGSAPVPDAGRRPGITSLAFLKKSSPASGISEVPNLRPGSPRSQRSRSLEIGIKEFPLIPGGFARADDPRCAIPVGMDDTDYHNAAEKTVASLSRFAVVSLVFARERGSLEYGAGLLEADAMLAPVGEAFFLVPLETAHRGAFSSEVAIT